MEADDTLYQHLNKFDIIIIAGHCVLCTLYALPHLMLTVLLHNTQLFSLLPMGRQEEAKEQQLQHLL
jgi:hypothetical protein